MCCEAFRLVTPRHPLVTVLPQYSTAWQMAFERMRGVRVIVALVALTRLSRYASNLSVFGIRVQSVVSIDTAL